MTYMGFTHKGKALPREAGILAGPAGLSLESVQVGAYAPYAVCAGSTILFFVWGNVGMALNAMRTYARGYKR